MRHSRLQSAGKKFRGLVKHGFDPISKGVENFENPKEDVEQLAKERLSDCLQCPKFQKEPIPFLRIEDKRIPQLSEMFCDACGCTSSYKLRQSLIVCPIWLK